MLFCYDLGLAGIQLLLREPQEAITYYREVLQLAARFSEGNKEAKLTVDKLQVIHTMHNLAQVLDTCQPDEPTLRDGTLRRDCADLEQKYMEKFRKEVSGIDIRFFVTALSLLLYLL